MSIIPDTFLLFCTKKINMVWPLTFFLNWPEMRLKPRT